MVLEVRQTKTQTLDLQPAGSSTLLERVVRTAAADKHAMDQTIEDLVDNNAGRAEVSWHCWQVEICSVTGADVGAKLGRTAA
jgi:hypothetical protein